MKIKNATTKVALLGLFATLVVGCGSGGGIGGEVEKKIDIPQQITNGVVLGDKLYYASADDNSAGLVRRLDRSGSDEKFSLQLDGKIAKLQVDGNSLVAKHQDGSFSYITDVDDKDSIKHYATQKFTFDAKGSQGNKPFECKNWNDYFYLGSVNKVDDKIYAGYSYIDDMDILKRNMRDDGFDDVGKYADERIKKCNPNGSWTGHNLFFNNYFKVAEFGDNLDVPSKTSEVLELGRWVDKTEKKTNLRKNRFKISYKFDDKILYIDSRETKSSKTEKKVTAYLVAVSDMQFNDNNRVFESDFKTHTDLLKAISFDDKHVVVINNTKENDVDSFDLLVLDKSTVPYTSQIVRLGGIQAKDIVLDKTSGALYILTADSLVHILSQDSLGQYTIANQSYSMKTIGLEMENTDISLAIMQDQLVVATNNGIDGGKIQTIDVDVKKYNEVDSTACKITVWEMQGNNNKTRNCIPPSKNVRDFKQTFDKIVNHVDIEQFETILIVRRILGLVTDEGKEWNWKGSIREIFKDDEELKKHLFNFTVTAIKDKKQTKIDNKKTSEHSIFTESVSNAFARSYGKEEGHKKFEDWKQHWLKEYLDYRKEQVIDKFKTRVRNAMVVDPMHWGFKFSDSTPFSYPKRSKEIGDDKDTMKQLLNSLTDADKKYLGARYIEQARELINK